MGVGIRIQLGGLKGRTEWQNAGIVASLTSRKEIVTIMKNNSKLTIVIIINCPFTKGNGRASFLRTLSGFRALCGF